MQHVGCGGLLKMTESCFQVLTLDVPLPEALQMAPEGGFGLCNLLFGQLILHLHELTQNTQQQIIA